MAFTEYLKETKEEMKHVSWPTRRQIVAYTSVVLIISAMLSIYLGALDYLFSFLLGYLVK